MSESTLKRQFAAALKFSQASTITSVASPACVLVLGVLLSVATGLCADPAPSAAGATTRPTTRIATTLPAGVVLRVTGDIDRRLDLTPEAWDKLPRTTIKVLTREGPEVAYAGVLLRDVLKAAQVPLGNHQLRGPWVNRTVHAHAPDGFAAAFALAELDDDLAERNILVADRKDGRPLAASEGPLRLIVPGEKRPARWVKMVTVIEVR